MENFMKSMMMTIVLFLQLFATTPLLAEGDCPRCRLMKGWGFAACPEEKIKEGSDVAIEGKVISVQEVRQERGNLEGVYLLVEVGEEKLPIRTGTLRKMKILGAEISPYERVKIRGVRVEYQGKEGIIAYTLERDGKVYTFREEK